MQQINRPRIAGRPKNYQRVGYAAQAIHPSIQSKSFRPSSFIGAQVAFEFDNKKVYGGVVRTHRNDGDKDLWKVYYPTQYSDDSASDSDERDYNDIKRGMRYFSELNDGKKT